jgi:hypothetical protein
MALTRTIARLRAVPDHCDACTVCGTTALWVVKVTSRRHPREPRCDVHSATFSRRVRVPESREP